MVRRACSEFRADMYLYHDNVVAIGSKLIRDAKLQCVSLINIELLDGLLLTAEH